MGSIRARHQPAFAIPALLYRAGLQADRPTLLLCSGPHFARSWLAKAQPLPSQARVRFTASKIIFSMQSNALRPIRPRLGPPSRYNRASGNACRGPLPRLILENRILTDMGPRSGRTAEKNFPERTEPNIGDLRIRTRGGEFRI